MIISVSVTSTSITGVTVVVVVECFPTQVELGMCRTSSVSPKPQMLVTGNETNSSPLIRAIIRCKT